MLPHQAASPFPPEKCSITRAAVDIAELIKSHLAYAHAIAAEIARKLPPELERIDIEGAAELGLVEAANSFDPTRGVQFKTFAYYRIKGAVYDGLRKIGWYPKGQYQQMRFAVAANEYLKDRFSEPQRSASPETQLQDLKDVTANLLSCYMLSLEAIPLEPEDQRASAEEIVVRDQEKANLRRSLARLPEINRRVLEMFYFDDLTMEDIGQKLSLSKSWVCRVHAKSLELLRKQLNQLTSARAAHSSATFSKTIR